MINDLYRKYFQKSFTFLYPLLEFKKNAKHKPLQTYIAWTDMYDPSSRKLVCVYKKEDTDQWKSFEREELLNHKMLDYCLPTHDENIIYVFDYNIYKEDFDNVVNGKYSKISKRAKQLLNSYYGIHTPEWVFVESYLFPESYFDKYAEILQVDVNELKKVGELCDMLDLEKETYVVENSEVTLI
jgi:hypothetical protein